MTSNFSIYEQIPDDWKEAIAPFFTREQCERLDAALAVRYSAGEEIFPARENIFRSITATHYRDVKAVWLGQDPYHEPGQAIGLAFAVPHGTQTPPSLRNIFREYADDLETVFIPTDTTLENWTRNGVLLLNTVLSVRAHEAASHRGLGWQALTGAIVKAVNAIERPVAFILLGNDAKTLKLLIDTERHVVFEAAHPSPLSAHRGFFGSRPFTTVNRLLVEKGAEPIDWRL